MSDATFIAVSVLTIGSAILALEFRELIYAAIALAASLLGIAMFFVILDATFVAMFQVTVYVGAVVVLVIFTIMLVRREAWLHVRDGRRKVLGAILGLGTMLFIGALFLQSGLVAWQESDVVSIKELSEEMLTYYSPALIVVAFTLAGSVIGALVLSKRDKGEEE